MSREFVVSGQSFMVSDQFLFREPPSDVNPLQALDDDMLIEEVVRLLWLRGRRGFDVKKAEQGLKDYVVEAGRRKKEFLIRRAADLYLHQSGRRVEIRT